MMKSSWALPRIMKDLLEQAAPYFPINASEGLLHSLNSNTLFVPIQREFRKNSDLHLVGL